MHRLVIAYADWYWSIHNSFDASRCVELSKSENDFLLLEKWDLYLYVLWDTLLATTLTKLKFVVSFHAVKKTSLFVMLLWTGELLTALVCDKYYCKHVVFLGLWSKALYFTKDLKSNWILLLSISQLTSPRCFASLQLLWTKVFSGKRSLFLEAGLRTVIVYLCFGASRLFDQLIII